MNKEILLSPIGFVRSDLKQRYETPRQGVLAKQSKAIIYLNPKNNFEQALKDLDGFERIWIIYQFHLNKNWKPLVTPPRHTRNKVGVFATRAPYRPNQIGLSCVKFDKVDGLKIFISESDILDGTPVFDIKPYLPYSDSFPGVKTGWAKSDLSEIYNVTISSKAKFAGEELKLEKDINLFDYARIQLEFNPIDLSRKRISKINAKKSGREIFALSYQDWQIHYVVDELKKNVKILNIIFVDRKKL
ncbi:MAG: tRNA (N6-threonylcarbamoyladenosine(37)-N6)-methyltransferase TrmO [Ignavibacteriales bacterium]|nr:tRNA (N6-threonylcarbamoyladenosine(37)-N6)-methyltransferase TrmO [Ignavibacteriales bacterium]